MLKNFNVPKNFGFVITVVSLGLVLISLLIFLYNSFFATPKDERATGSNSGSVDYDMGEDVVAPDKGGYYPPVDGGGSADNEDEQKLIKTGSFDILVDDFDEVLGNVKQSAKQLGGLVVSTNDSGVGEDRSVKITVKVPATAFDTFVEKVKGYASVVNSYTEDTTDVTKTYQDLEARLKNEKALESKLVEILGKATKVSEILEVQRELSQVQQNIEVMESQLKYYNSQIEMSSVTISMELSSESLEVTGDKWQPVGVFKEAVASLVMLLKDLGTFVIWAAVFSPVLLLLYLVARLVSKRVTIK